MHHGGPDDGRFGDGQQVAGVGGQGVQPAADPGQQGGDGLAAGRGEVRVGQPGGERPRFGGGEFGERTAAPGARVQVRQRGLDGVRNQAQRPAVCRQRGEGADSTRSARGAARARAGASSASVSGRSSPNRASRSSAPSAGAISATRTVRPPAAAPPAVMPPAVMPPAVMPTTGRTPTGRTRATRRAPTVRTPPGRRGRPAVDPAGAGATNITRSSTAPPSRGPFVHALVAWRAAPLVGPARERYLLGEQVHINDGAWKSGESPARSRHCEPGAAQSADGKSDPPPSTLLHTTRDASSRKEVTPPWLTP